MSSTFTAIQKLVLDKNILISSHGYDELAENGLFVSDAINSISEVAA